MFKLKSKEQGGHTQGGQPAGVVAKAELRLSNAALILLGAAAGRADGSLPPPPASCLARGKALERVLGSLLKAGLVYEVPVAAEQQAWRMNETGQGVGLAITDAGRRAIGMPEAQSKGSAAAEGPTGKARAPGKPRLATRGHAAAVSPSVSEVSATANTRAGSVGPEQPRQTKQTRLIGLLSEPGGQSVAVLGEALGWLPHTVRAALTGLRQKGFTLTKSKDEAGTTVYRLDGVAGTAGPAAKAA